MSTKKYYQTLKEFQLSSEYDSLAYERVCADVRGDRHRCLGDLANKRQGDLVEFARIYNAYQRLDWESDKEKSSKYLELAKSVALRIVLEEVRKNELIVDPTYPILMEENTSDYMEWLEKAESLTSKEDLVREPKKHTPFMVDSERDLGQALSEKASVIWITNEKVLSRLPMEEDTKLSYKERVNFFFDSYAGELMTLNPRSFLKLLYIYRVFTFKNGGNTEVVLTHQFDYDPKYDEIIGLENIKFTISPHKRCPICNGALTKEEENNLWTCDRNSHKFCLAEKLYQADNSALFDLLYSDSI